MADMLESVEGLRVYRVARIPCVAALLVQICALLRGLLEKWAAGEVIAAVVAAPKAELECVLAAEAKSFGAEGARRRIARVRRRGFQQVVLVVARAVTSARGVDLSALGGGRKLVPFATWFHEIFSKMRFLGYCTGASILLRYRNNIEFGCVEMADFIRPCKFSLSVGASLSPDSKGGGEPVSALSA